MRKLWHFTPALPIKPAPYWDWPLRPLASLRYLAASWRPLGVRLLLLALAVLIWAFATPELARMERFAWDWVALIWLRNFVLLVAIAGGLHLLLWRWRVQGDDYRYDLRPMAKGSRTFFFADQVKDNIMLTLGPSLLWWTLWECLMLWAYANGYLTIISFTHSPIWFCALILLIPLWAGFYFYWQHRLLHMKAIYKHVHQWHHKNVNTGPWSGLAMHPVESFILMSDLAILLVIASHPIHGLFLLLHHGVGAPTSHAGFEHVKLGRKWRYEVGDFFHQLHHRFVDCNYGTYETPWDRLFGTFHDGTTDANAAMNERRRALRNET